MIISNERNFFTVYLDSFWMQCLDPKHDCIWCINQSTSQTVDWKIKVEREKKTLPMVTLYLRRSQKACQPLVLVLWQSNRQTIVNKTSQNQTHLGVNTLVHGAFLQHWVKNARSFMHNRNLSIDIDSSIWSLVSAS